MNLPSLNSRYGIYEWFGEPVSEITKAQRVQRLKSAVDKNILAHRCPFAGALIPDATCSKPGGVCTLRRYENVSGKVTISPEPPVTVCPQRFLQDLGLLRWAGEVMLQSRHPIAIKEIPFLAKLDKEDADEGEGKKAGRIDWVLVHPKADASLKWCAIESQAVYFSGRAMLSEFENWANAKSKSMPFPTETRRPDYRSSGPKRLAPQLQVKVPELRNWGAKTAVIVDEFFFSEMSALPELRGSQSDRLANADVVWLVAKYENGRLVPSRTVFSRLDDSIRALNATRPVGKTAFEAEIQSTLNDQKKTGRRVFRL
jgi:hypothetical protein